MDRSHAPQRLQEVAPELVRQVGLILAALAAVVARRFLQNPKLVLLIVPLWHRLTKVSVRLGRVRARGLAPVRARQAGVRRGPAVLPRGKAWLLHELGYEAAGHASQLAHVLSAPAAQAVLAAMPGAGRVLRPLCRMLGLPAALAVGAVPEAVMPKPAPRAVAAALLPAGVWVPLPVGPEPALWRRDPGRYLVVRG